MDTEQGDTSRGPGLHDGRYKNALGYALDVPEGWLAVSNDMIARDLGICTASRNRQFGADGPKTPSV